MTKTDTAEPPGKAMARARLDDIAALYQGMRDLLAMQIVTAREDQSLSPKALVTRLTDVQTAQLLLLKAEEKFRDSFGTADDTESAGDTTALRVEIGRKLDRLRDTGATTGVSGQAD